MSYKFTSDWFSNNIPVWEHYLSHLKGKPNLNFLEIGSYEGRSTIWTLENILTDPTCKITCIDLFEEIPDIGYHNGYTDRFVKNVEHFSDKVLICKGLSHRILRSIMDEGIYDFAYIDGSHTAYETLTDAVLVNPLVKRGGLIIFDDYPLVDQADPSPQNNPELAINAFCQVFEKQYEILHIGWQVIIKKL